MNMDNVNELKWACIGLLHIRRLDTKDRIDQSLNLWKEGKQVSQQQNKTSMQCEETRVAH
jgi:hypothetical protein